MSSAKVAFAAQSGRNDELALLRSGGKQTLAELFSRYRSRLERMVQFRLDPRLVGRIDPSDVVQEAYIEAARRIDLFLAAPAVTLFVWLRQITWQTLLTVHRRHLGQKRNAGQEISLQATHRNPSQSSPVLPPLAGSLTSPSQAAIRNEHIMLLLQTIGSMDPIDKRILVLRHFEQLSNLEVAQILRIKPTAASNRYVRALKRLRVCLDSTALRDE